MWVSHDLASKHVFALGFRQQTCFNQTWYESNPVWLVYVPFCSHYTIIIPPFETLNWPIGDVTTLKLEDENPTIHHPWMSSPMSSGWSYPYGLDPGHIEWWYSWFSVPKSHINMVKYFSFVPINFSVNPNIFTCLMMCFPLIKGSSPYCWWLNHDICWVMPQQWQCWL